MQFNAAFKMPDKSANKTGISDNLKLNGDKVIGRRAILLDNSAITMSFRRLSWKLDQSINVRRQVLSIVYWEKALLDQFLHYHFLHYTR